MDLAEAMKITPFSMNYSVNAMTDAIAVASAHSSVSKTPSSMRTMLSAPSTSLSQPGSADNIYIPPPPATADPNHTATTTNNITGVAYQPHPRNQNRKRSSPVWEVFYAIESDGNRKNVKCSLCETVLTFLGSTTTMNYHIKTKHPDHPCNFMPPIKKAHEGGKGLVGEGGAGQFSPHSPSPLCSAPKLDSIKYVCKAVTQWIIKDLLPVSVVEGDGFREMMAKVDPRISNCLPSRQLVENEIELRYALVRQTTGLHTQSFHHGCLAMEEWTSASNDTYMTVNMHTITDDWVAKNFLLRTFRDSDPHSPDTVAEEISMIRARWNLSTDGFGTLVTNSPGTSAAVTCFDKVIQECVEQGLKVSGISEAVVSARQIVNFCEQGASYDTMLHHKLGVSENLLREDTNKWHTTYTMLQCLLSHREAIEALSHSTSNAGTIQIYPSDDLWLQIRQIVDAMKPLSAALTALGAKNNSCVSTVYPLVHRLLQHHLLPAKSDSATVERFKKNVTKTLRSYYNFQEVTDDNKAAIFSTFLDPRYKDLKFLTSTLRHDIIQQIGLLVKIKKEITDDDLELNMYVKSEMESTHQEDNSRPSSQESFQSFEQPHNSQKSQQEVAMDFLLGDDAGEKVAPSSELEAYLAEASVSYNSDPLAWWRQHAGSFPQLARLARRYLCIPATAVPANSLLSNTTFTRHRHYAAATVPDLLDKLIFLNSNMTISTEL